MMTKDDIKRLLIQYSSRLQKLKERQARLGIDTPPQVLIEIEEIEATIENLEADLKTVKDTAQSSQTMIASLDSPVRSPLSNEEEQRGGKRVIKMGDNARYYESINTSGGDIVGGDQIKITGVSLEDVEALFKRLYTQIDTRPNTSPEDKADLKAEVQEIQREVNKSGEVDETFLARRLRNIQRIAPDILEVVIATLTNPVAGFSTVVSKVARRIKESAE